MPVEKRKTEWKSTQLLGDSVCVSSSYERKSTTKRTIGEIERERKKDKMMHDRKKTKNEKKLIVVLPLDLLAVVVVVAAFMNEGAS